MTSFETHILVRHENYVTFLIQDLIGEKANANVLVILSLLFHHKMSIIAFYPHHSFTRLFVWFDHNASDERVTRRAIKYIHKHVCFSANRIPLLVAIIIID